MHMWRAMISGPDGTPYAGGLFIFDILCSSDYPNSAPKVNLCTTGGGSVRFNPNLYNCGKVCLSLLGTWQGEQAESWHPKTSTLLQVLMSVQALILVPDPFFNEPGYERIRGTPEGDKQAREYNEVIREATIRYAMIDNLRKPPPELRQAILSHFALRRADILANVRAMAAEKANSNAHTARMGTLLKQLEEAIDTYAPPSVLAQA
jgi:baculoviral IAP repeat-containing protein 6